MKVFLKKNVDKIGKAGEIITVNDGFARNYLMPRDLVVEITEHNLAFYKKKSDTFKNQKEVVAVETSKLSETIKNLKFSLKKKMHDDGKLYASVSQNDIVALLADKGISISKNQVMVNKAIKTKGTHEITIKLTSQLQPTFNLTILPE